MTASIIGQALRRPDGPAKVSGGALYTADTPVAGATFAALVGSTSPSGRIVGIEDEAARRAPGVLAVVTHENAPRLAEPAGAAQSWLPLQDDRIRHEGQPVALVVAETLEQAQHAARLVQVRYAAEPARLEFRDHLDERFAAETNFPADTAVGDVDGDLAEADTVIRHTYHTTDRHHSPLETSATIADWDGDQLTLYDATQWVWGVRSAVATAFGLSPGEVRVLNHFVGGGFGCKGFVWQHQFLAPLAARIAGRPVKLQLTRAQAFTAHGYQPGTLQEITLGATAAGNLTAIRHHSVSPTSIADDYIEYAAISPRSLYGCPSIETQHRIVRVHRNLPTPMRAPHEGPGMVALEIAMDELAYELAIDPVELRLRNYAETDPSSGEPFSSKRLRDCYREGSDRFGWDGRPMEPGTMREGHDLIGWGMATAIMQTFRMPASARITIDRAGEVVIESGTQEIGTGIPTIMPQIAADVLGVDPARVRLVLGDTDLPETGGTFGSSTTLSLGSAVHDGALRLRARLAELAGGDVGLDAAHVGEILARSGRERLSVEGSWRPDRGGARSMHSYGAVFAEVRVDEDLRITRVTRLVGVYSAGRIINPRTARSQMIGGLTWGIGQALLESSELDPHLGRYLSKNLAGYLLPVNADVHQVEVAFIEDEVDLQASPLGARGIGELGAVGVGAAIANAVFHATGVRVREVPIRPEMLLD